MPPRCLIVYNRPLLPENDAEAISEQAVDASVSAVDEHLTLAGWKVTRRALSRVRRSLREPLEPSPHVIFNLFEGWPDDPASEARIARRLERWRLPLTGSSARALRTAGQKQRAKRVLEAAGLPTPAWTLIRRSQPVDCALSWPMILKPALYHGSIGIEQASVVTNASELAHRAGFLRARFRGPVLVEEFKQGRELTIGVLQRAGLVALPPMEFEFVDRGTAWPIVSYDAKWSPESSEYQTTPARHDAPLDTCLRQALQQLALRAFLALGCRDYVRVDFRLDENGRPWILEVNPNPDMGPAACLAGALAAARIDYGQWIVSLAEAALARGDPAQQRARTRSIVQ